MDSEKSGRPAVMENLSDTQLNELDQNYDETDEQGFIELTKSYGWSEQECKAVWKHLGERPNLSGSQTGGKGSTSTSTNTSTSGIEGAGKEPISDVAAPMGDGDASFAGSGSMGGVSARGDEENNEIF